MSGQLHWWLVAVSFGLGMVLTFAMMMRPANVRMPAWVYPEPAAEPPVMAVATSEAPTQRIPVAKPRPAKKAVGKVPPRKRRPVPEDAVTERIPVARKRPAKKVPGKKVPGKRVRPRDPARRIAKDAVTEQIQVAETVPTPLIPYAPYGPGSMRAEPDGTGPEGWTVKGRTDSRLFFRPDDPGYDDVEAQVWFENEDFATRAFFMPGGDSAPTAD